MRNTYVTVSKNAADTKQGTHAALITNDILSIYDLLYCLMLPSGNDAGVALAEYVGCMLLSRKKSDSNNIDGYKKFIKYMNKTTKKFHLNNSHFMNCHGMKHDGNFTSSYDLLKLTLECQKYELFNRVTSTIKYECHIKNHDIERVITYENTHLLLGCDGYINGKTGWIPNCNGHSIHGNLWSVVDRYNRKLSIIVLGSINLDMRFEDTEKLINWIYSCFGYTV